MADRLQEAATQILQEANTKKAQVHAGNVCANCRHYVIGRGGDTGNCKSPKRISIIKSSVGDDILVNLLVANNLICDLWEQDGSVTGLNRYAMDNNKSNQV